MAYKDYLKQKAARDESLRKYHLAHPEMSQRALAKVFKISQARISKILKGERGK
jgi:predicted XRE-type DNA-binding protein